MPTDVLAAAAVFAAAVVVLIPPRRSKPPALTLDIDHTTHRPAVAVVASASAPLVRLLGPLGCDPPFDQVSRRGKELVAYLASHPDGGTEDRLRAVLWDRPPTRGSFNNLISAVRTTLGTIDGEVALPHLGADRRYRRAASVTTDLARFAALVAEGEDAAALELVRGCVFDEGRLDWAAVDGTAGWWERSIVDAAHRLGRRCLTDGDVDGALSAAAKGLLAAPGDELLFRDRMLAWDHAGNPAAAESVMAELCAHLGGADPAEVLHPETLEVYRRCGRGRVLGR